MLVTYLRSSLLGSYEFCENKAFMCYTLGLQDRQNSKAQLGSCTHKILELAGRCKIAKQNKKKFFIDDDFGKINVKDATFEYFNDLAYKHYDDQFPGLMPKMVSRLH